MNSLTRHSRRQDSTMKLAAAFAAVIAAALAGCGSQDRIVMGNGALNHIELGDDRISLHGDGGIAVITDKGDLSIEGKAVNLTPDQRAQAQRLYTNAIGVRDDGVALGKAGAGMAGKAVGSAIEGLVKGDPGSAGDKMDAEADNMAQQAMRLCKRVIEMRKAQDSLVETLPAFKPYATLSQGDVIDCRS